MSITRESVVLLEREATRGAFVSVGDVDNHQVLSSEAIAAHCREIDRCNQRGGRMLSLVDLVRARTLDLDLAAYLAAVVSRGGSFLVGALPGGAGKTTVMGALLNFVPPDCRLVAADSGSTIRRTLSSPAAGRDCYICHEIGSGPYFAYLWGREARDFFSLPAAGQMVATNLHADTIEQCSEQLCCENGVRRDDFRRCSLCLFVARPGRNWRDQRRRIVGVHESDGESPHRLLWQWSERHDRFDRVGQSNLLAAGDSYLQEMRGLLSGMIEGDICTIADVRLRFVEFACCNADET